MVSEVNTRYEHIAVDESGVAVIAGSTMRVSQLVAEKRAYGWSPEELHFQHPYLSLGQIYSALAYYWDHAEQIDRELEEELAFVDKMQRETPEPPIIARLRAARQRP